jgi:hypothetical protein
MTFGLNVYRNTGQLTYSSDDVTWNQVDFFFVPANTGVANQYDVLEGRESLLAQVFVDAPPSNRKAQAKNLYRSGNVVHVEGGSEGAYILVMMR